MDFRLMGLEGVRNKLEVSVFAASGFVVNESVEQLFFQKKRLVAESGRHIHQINI